MCERQKKGREEVIITTIPYTQYPYPQLEKKDEKEGKFKKFLEMLTQLQVNISFREALEKMSVYAKFVKDLFINLRKLTYND